MMEKFWTPQETQILLNNFGKTPVTEIMRYIPGRSAGAIRGKATRLGLKSALRQPYPPTIGQSATSDTELLEELSGRGFIITKGDLPKTDQTYEMPKLLEPTEIGVVSDTHLGSNYQQLSHLNNFYDVCQERGITTILNAGDICAGNGRIFRGQVYEQFIHGADATINYVSENYPKRNGIQTLMIAGNHDESFYKNEGIDIVNHVAKRRNDIEYLGMHGAYVTLGNINIYLMHPSGGVPYARSYRAQKICEQISPQNKPHILIMGHMHVANHLPMYRNIECFNVGSFEAQTPYLKRRGLYPSLSGLILKIHPNERGLDGISTYWKYYFEPIENDY